MNNLIARRLIKKSLSFLNSNLDPEIASDLFLDGENEFTEEQLSAIEMCLEFLISQFNRDSISIESNQSGNELISDELTAMIMGWRSNSD